MRSLFSVLAFLQGGGGFSPLYFAWWGGGGWCGTPYPGWWRHPHPRDPAPWWTYKLIGIVAGIAGGWVFSRFGPHPEPWVPALSVLGAFITARVVGDLFAIARGANKAA